MLVNAPGINENVLRLDAHCFWSLLPFTNKALFISYIAHTPQSKSRKDFMSSCALYCNKGWFVLP